MTHSTADEAPAIGAREFDQFDEVGRIEVDRYCDGCGYNLFQQRVRRDARTKLLLAQCPECGAFACATDQATVGRLWLKRLSTAILAIWMIVLCGLILAGPFFHLVNGVAMLEEVYWVERIDWQSVGNQDWRRDRVEWVHALKYITTGVAFGIGALNLFFASALLPHWSRRARWIWTGVALLLSMLGLVSVLHLNDMLGLLWKILGTIVSHYIAFAVGAAVMITFGRPLARLIVRLLLPKKLRGPLGYLWRADGLEPPF